MEMWTFPASVLLCLAFFVKIDRTKGCSHDFYEERKAGVQQMRT